MEGDEAMNTHAARQPLGHMDVHRHKPTVLPIDTVLASMLNEQVSQIGPSAKRTK